MKRGQYKLGEGLGGPALACDEYAVSPGLFLLNRVAFRNLQTTSGLHHGSSTPTLCFY